MFRNHRYTSIVISVVAAVALAACGGGESEDAGQSAPATRPQSATSAPRSEPTQPADESEPTQSASAAAVDETSNIPDIEAGLESLASYRARFTFSFEEKDDDGKERKGSLEFVQEVIAESKDKHIRMAGAGLGDEASEGGAFELFTVGGVSYIYSMDDGVARCISFSSDESESNPAAMFKPNDVLGGLNKARLVERSVTVNGVKTDHYVVDQSGMDAGVFSAASGDIWVAQDGNFVVKYTGTATGKVELLGSDANSTVTWNYQLEEINTLSSIELPPECVAQKPADDIPVPAGATDKGQFGGMITFKTTDTAEQVAEFYQAEMPAQGWTEGEASEFGGIRTLSFTKDDRSLSIMISPGDDGTSVIITEKKGE